MDEILKKLLKDKVLNEDTRDAIAGAFSKALEEAKAEQEKQIRADLAEQYEKDKAAIHAAFETFLEQEMREHVAEFKASVEEVDKLKLAYAEKTQNIKEAVQKHFKQRVAAMEKAIGQIIKREISELHESEMSNRRAYVKAITDKTAQLEEERQAFRKKAASVLENIINVKVAATLEELREDIQAAREADFGRELYEAFMTTFRRQHFSSSKEFQRVTKALGEATEELKKVKATAAKAVAEARKEAKTADAARKKVEEGQIRRAKMVKLLSGLEGTARAKMKTILESSKTADLEKNFRKFVPEVLNENKKTASPTQKQEKLEEAVVELKTGGQERITETEAAEDDDEIAEIRRRAGNG